jgi:hypothetical protein
MSFRALLDTLTRHPSHQIGLSSVREYHNWVLMVAKHRLAGAVGVKELLARQ